MSGAISVHVASNTRVITGLLSAHGGIQHELLIVDLAVSTSGPAANVSADAATVSAVGDGQDLLLRRRLGRLGRIPRGDPVVGTADVPPFERGLGTAFGVAKHLFGYVAFADVYDRLGHGHVPRRICTHIVNTSDRYFPLISSRYSNNKISPFAVHSTEKFIIDSDTGGPTSLPLLRQLYSVESVMGSRPRGQLFSMRHINVLRTASKSFFNRSAGKYSVSIEYLREKGKT